MIKRFSETIENETNEQKGRFVSMLLGKLDARLLGNLLSKKKLIKGGDAVVESIEGNIRRVQEFQCQLAF